jgi:thiamine biosynthesis lipoprotein
MELHAANHLGATMLPMRRFRALGTSCVLVMRDDSALETAESILRHHLSAIDRACSRFRADSEISAVHRANGGPVVISRLLADAVEVALSVAEWTDGAVDPTVGTSLISLGYDRDFDQIRDSPGLPSVGLRAARGWRSVSFEARTRVLRVPAGVVLDLGATAKALAADRAAAHIAEATGVGALVNLGGDISAAGRAPLGGWPIGLALDCQVAPEDTAVTVAIASGGLASSGTSVRTWRAGTRTVHHIIDPMTGDCARTRWQLVSVAARTCVEANAASTAGIVWGDAALERLSALRLPCRLVRDDGSVVTLGGWPEDRSSASNEGERSHPCPR